jgi:hypothetical protein
MWVFWRDAGGEQGDASAVTRCNFVFFAGCAKLLLRVQHLENDMKQPSKPASHADGSASESMRREMVGVA